MDDRALDPYFRELIRQRDMAFFAAARLQRIDYLGRPASQTTMETHAHVQAILSAGALVAKLLAPSEKNAFAQNRGKLLTAVTGIPDALASREVRNAIEHFDDRLDQIVRAGPPYNITDSNVGPIAGFDPRQTPLRHFDPETREASVLDKSISIVSLLGAMLQVASAAETWLLVRGRYVG